MKIKLTFIQWLKVLEEGTFIYGISKEPVSHAYKKQTSVASLIFYFGYK